MCVSVNLRCLCLRDLGLTYLRIQFFTDKTGF